MRDLGQDVFFTTLWAWMTWGPPSYSCSGYWFPSSLTTWGFKVFFTASFYQKSSAFVFLAFIPFIAFKWFIGKEANRGAVAETKRFNELKLINLLLSQLNKFKVVNNQEAQTQRLSRFLCRPKRAEMKSQALSMHTNTFGSLEFLFMAFFYLKAN